MNVVTVVKTKIKIIIKTISKFANCTHPVVRRNCSFQRLEFIMNKVSFSYIVGVYKRHMLSSTHTKYTVCQINFSSFQLRSPKFLAAFDFDYTIVSNNSDIVARDLIPASFTISDQVNELYNADNSWTKYMGEIFKILHETKVSKNDIQTAITSIPEVTGMVQLIQNLVEMNFEVIIISDSNMEFIRCWCDANGLTKSISHVYSNPANFDENDLLTIQPFHKQTTCQMSQMNLCKGQVLDEHIDRHSTDGSCYDKVFYVGDGSNDYCPITKLRTEDVGCARVGFKLEKLLAESSIVKAETLLWDNGIDLLDKIKEKV